jgi:hypothetical protein
VDAGEVDEVKIETGLHSCSDDEKWDEGERHRAVPKKADNHENEKEVKTVKEFFVVDVLHLAHST